MVKIDDGIVDSLNRGYFTSVNWAILHTLEPIGMVLYKRLVFTFSHLLSTGTSPKDLQLEKDYGALCRDWLGGLKPERYRSKILSNQLGRHLGDLRKAGVIRRCDIEKRADASGFKLVFLPGRRFFADHEALTPARGSRGCASGSLRTIASSASRCDWSPTSTGCAATATASSSPRRWRAPRRCWSASPMRTCAH
jgi:hypothetical protein